MRDITVGFVGSGGVGAVTSGVILTEAAAVEGLHAMNVQSYGPQIRGGESSAKVRISQDPVLSPGDQLDVCVIYQLSEYPKFRHELAMKEDCIVLYDPGDPLSPNFTFDVKPSMKLWPVPFGKLAKEDVGLLQTANIVSLGVLAHMFNLPLEGIKSALRSRFARKGEEVLNTNFKALEIGRNYAVKNVTQSNGLRLEYTSSEPKLVMTGNEATALGALRAGCNFFAGYPITPSSEVMHALAKYLFQTGGKFVQTEDEISAVTHCIGASFAGARAMTATSGPGVSLMTEGLGLASMAEIPLVIVNVQRGGPSTGLPTKTEQGDLMQAIYGTHGDAPKAVLAPNDVPGCFSTMVAAFYVAETYQLPVIVLSDQSVGQRLETFSKQELLSGFNRVGVRLQPSASEIEDYHRYRDTENGVSPMSVPGTAGGEYLASGIEHNEKGWPSALADMHNKMMAKRYRKLDALEQDVSLLDTYGGADAEYGAVAWGSNKGVVQEACQRLADEGYKVKAIVPGMLYPFNSNLCSKELGSLKKYVVFESSWSGQFYKYLHSSCPRPDQAQSYAIAGGRNLTVKEVYDAMKDVMS